MSDTKISRRSILKGAAVLAAMPVLGMSTGAFAAQNAAMRTALKYQPKPNGANKCATCSQFKKPNGCNMMPGDTEISPEGWCSGFQPIKK